MSASPPPVHPQNPPAAPTPPVRSLIRKLSEVLAAVERVPKRGHNDHFNYDFAREADLVEVVRAELAKRQVMIFPDVEKCETREVPGNKGPLFITRMEVNFTVEDGESGERRIFKAIGEGEDNHDKGCYKAITGALKYALMKLFLIPTGDDPEASKKPRDQREPSPVSGARPEPSGGAPTHFPKFGKGDGAPIRDAAPAVLEFHIAAARKSLADPQKAKWHAKEFALLCALETEFARQRNEMPDKKAPVAQPRTDAGRAPMFDPAAESEEHAKMRLAGAFYAKAVKAGANAGWEQAAVGKWLRENRGRGGKGEVTAEDAELFCQHLEPPPDIANFTNEPGAQG